MRAATPVGGCSRRVIAQDIGGALVIAECTRRRAQSSAARTECNGNLPRYRLASGRWRSAFTILHTRGHDCGINEEGITNDGDPRPPPNATGFSRRAELAMTVRAAGESSPARPHSSSLTARVHPCSQSYRPMTSQISFSASTHGLRYRQAKPLRPAPGGRARHRRLGLSPSRSQNLQLDGGDPKHTRCSRKVKIPEIEGQRPAPGGFAIDNLS